MGQIYVYRKGNRADNKTLQEYKSKSGLHHQKQFRETLKFKTTKHATARQIRKKWSIPTQLPHVPQEVHRSERSTIPRKVPRTLQRLQVRVQQIEVRTTSLKRGSCVWPNERYNGYSPLCEKRKTARYSGEILNLRSNKKREPN